jgi:FMN reductase
MTTIVAVVGSVTPPGRLSRAITEALERGRGRGIESTLIDLATIQLPFADGSPLSGDAAAVVEQLSNADAVLLATPVYRASLTGSLKNLLDLTPVEPLESKACGIVAMGATAHHSLGPESHLRDILAWFGALVAPTSVYLASGDFAGGALSVEAASQLDALIDSLAALAGVAGTRALGPRPFAAGKG